MEIVCPWRREEDDMDAKIERSDKEWRSRLTPQQYEVTRRKGTEPPFTGKYHDFHTQGHVPVRLLRSRPVQFRGQVRFRHGLAQLHGADLG